MTGTFSFTVGVVIRYGSRFELTVGEGIDNDGGEGFEVGTDFRCVVPGFYEMNVVVVEELLERHLVDV